MTTVDEMREERTALICEWCREAVDTPQPGWKPGDASYCSRHHSVNGRHPLVVGHNAAVDALRTLHTPVEDLIRWPWRAVHQLTGALAPGRVAYVAAFPGNGKTTFLTRCLHHWIKQGLRVTYLPLEADPSEAVTRLACHDAGVDADDYLRFSLHERAAEGDRAAQSKIDDVETALELMATSRDVWDRLRIDPISELTPRHYANAIAAARDMESDLIVTDHVDHAEADPDVPSSDIQLSNEIQRLSLLAAKRLQIPVVLATQLNSSRTGGDRLAHYREPPMDWLYNKGKKEQIAATAIGLFRPIDPNADPKMVRAVRGGNAEAWRIALPHRMGVTGMKLRFGGATKGRTVHLKYEHGELGDLSPNEQHDFDAAQHGIETQPWYLRED